MKIILILSILILAFSSCKDSVVIEVPEEKAFDYKAYLLRNNDDNVPTIDFPANASSEEIFKIIDNYTQQDCFDAFRFNYKIGAYEVQCFAAEFCHNPPSPSNPTKLWFEINNENELWFDYKIIKSSQVKDESLKFLNTIERHNKRFIIRFKVDSKSDVLITEKILEDIIEAYLTFSTSLFKQEYGKPINQASQLDLDDFKRKHGMLIVFYDIESLRVPPPPPAASEINNEF
ncbi:hypothetical protein JCM19275_1786 [Nonlabens ulvanivorans]|uniref:Lipoprotein n=1 Tax=Nonlabens ulvanivorans TaxID=906888 RepID=A0A090WKA5_NONUL|nr:hypothetical protein [Nonlabens ulvanivorans]GAL76638.1 hypothetical protein JCM19275_1786 [Nonlabens ulvanivorans]